jgi:hypothetical protein
VESDPSFRWGDDPADVGLFKALVNADYKLEPPHPANNF